MPSTYIKCPRCEEEIEINLRYEPNDPEVGIHEGYTVEDEIPSVCPNEDCKAEFTDEEIAALEKDADDAAAEYDPGEPEPDYFDYSYEDYLHNRPDD